MHATLCGQIYSSLHSASQYDYDITPIIIRKIIYFAFQNRSGDVGGVHLFAMLVVLVVLMVSMHIFLRRRRKPENVELKALKSFIHSFF